MNSIHFYASHLQNTCTLILEHSERWTLSKKRRERIDKLSRHGNSTQLVICICLSNKDPDKASNKGSLCLSSRERVDIFVNRHSVCKPQAVEQGTDMNINFQSTTYTIGNETRFT